MSRRRIKPGISLATIKTASTLFDNNTAALRESNYKISAGKNMNTYWRKKWPHLHVAGKYEFKQLLAPGNAISPVYEIIFFCTGCSSPLINATTTRMVPIMRLK